MTIDEKIKKEVYRLALEGKSDQEISEIYRREKNQINKWINDLKVPSSPVYNLALYNQIIFERNALRGIVDKDLLEEIIELLNRNFTFVEVAILLNSTEKEVQKIIKVLNMKSSPFYDPELYKNLMTKNTQNMRKKEEEIFHKFQKVVNEGIDLHFISDSELVKKFYRRQNVRRIVELLVQSNFQATDQFLAKSCGVSPFFVEKTLNDRDDEHLIRLLYGEELVAKIKQARHDKAYINRNAYKKDYRLVQEKSDEQKERVNTIENNIQFWFKILFTFKLSLQQFGELVQVTDLDLLSKMLFVEAKNTNKYYINALKYLFGYTSNDKNTENLKKAKNYLLWLSEAKKKDPMRYRNLLEYINDKEYKDIVKKHAYNLGMTLSDEEVEKIIKYRLKYALPQKVIPFNWAYIKPRCPEYLLDELEELNRVNYENSVLYGPYKNSSGSRK